MTLKIGRNVNTNDTATLSDKIDVDITPATTILAANAKRMFCSITVRKKAAWIKLQAASVDNDQKGIFIERDQTWESIPDNVYIGEISAVGKDNNSEIYVTEF